MGLLEGILRGVGHLTLVVCDMAILFFLARILAPRTRWRIVRAVDQAGSLFVQAIRERVGRLLTRVGLGQPEGERYDVFLLLVLLIVRLAVAGLFEGR